MLTPLSEIHERATQQKHHPVEQAEGCTRTGSASASREAICLLHTQVQRLASPGFHPKLEQQKTQIAAGPHRMVWVSEWWRRR